MRMRTLLLSFGVVTAIGAASCRHRDRDNPVVQSAEAEYEASQRQPVAGREDVVDKDFVQFSREQLADLSGRVGLIDEKASIAKGKERRELRERSAEARRLQHDIDRDLTALSLGGAEDAREDLEDLVDKNLEKLERTIEGNDYDNERVVLPFPVTP